MIRHAGTRAAVIAAVALLAACSSGVSNSLDQTSLLRAGGPAGSGGVCAYYAGAKGSGRLGIKDDFRRRACFSTAARCQSWLYEVQSRFPVTYLRKGCGS